MSDTPPTSDHYLIPGWFTREQWAELSPHVDRLILQPAGILLIAVMLNRRGGTIRSWISEFLTPGSAKL
jgi:hypothetical protein